MNKFNFKVPFSPTTGEGSWASTDIQSLNSQQKWRLAGLYSFARNALFYQLSQNWGWEITESKRLPEPFELEVKTLCFGLHRFAVKFRKGTLGGTNYDQFESSLFLLDRQEVEGQGNIELHEPSLVGRYIDNGRSMEIRLEQSSKVITETFVPEPFSGAVRLFLVYPNEADKDSYLTIRVQTPDGELHPPTEIGTMQPERYEFANVCEYLQQQTRVKFIQGEFQVRQSQQRWAEFLRTRQPTTLTELVAGRACLK